MNDLSAITASLNSAISAPSAGALVGDPNNLGQEDFLKLMITQFRNQDPTKPTDSTQFLGQLAQFSTVSGIQSLGRQFSALANSLQGDQALRAAGLIGRNVLFSSPLLPFDGTISQGAVENPIAGGEISVQIADLSGRLVRSIDLGSQPAGLLDFSWDGKAADGTTLPARSYVMTAQVKSGGDVRAVETFARAPVLGVNLATGSGQAMLRIEGVGELSLAQIREIL